MNQLNQEMDLFLRERGADLVGFGSLEELPKQVRSHMPVGISVGVLW